MHSAPNWTTTPPLTPAPDNHIEDALKRATAAFNALYHTWLTVDQVERLLALVAMAEDAIAERA